MRSSEGVRLYTSMNEYFKLLNALKCLSYELQPVINATTSHNKVTYHDNNFYYGFAIKKIN